MRATARLADVLAVSFEATCTALAGAAPRVPCYVTGTPIRDTRAIDRAAARDRLGIPAGERVLLIFGGSQAVRRFNAAVSGAVEPARRAGDRRPRDRRRRPTPPR